MKSAPLRRTLFALFMALGLCATSYAQDYVGYMGSPLPQVFSPNAAELGKYERTPVNYFNGLPSITVPLTEVHAKGYNLPVYLSYHASGNKPDQHPGWVGQGWTLNAGGAISRVVNGMRDEMSKEEYDFDHGYGTVNPGYFYHMAETQGRNWDDFSTLLSAGDIRDYKDYEPDEFILNIEGIHASFFFVGEDEIRIVSRMGESFNAHFELTTETNGPGLELHQNSLSVNRSMKAYRFTYIQSITVADLEGNKYYFGGDDSAIEYSIMPRPTFRIEGNQLNNVDEWKAVAIPNTWLLTRIERPDGEVISFSYAKDGMPIVKSDLHYGEAYALYNGRSTDPPHNYDTRLNPSNKNNLSFFFLQPSYLTRISCRVSGDYLDFSSARTVEKEYDISEDDFKLRVGDYRSTHDVSFSMWMSKNYYNQLSSIDGKGRHISFSYTANREERLKLQEVRFKTAGGSPGVVDNKYSFSYNSTRLPGYNAKQSDIWGFYNGIYYGNSFGTFGSGLESVRVPNASKMQAEILTGITYPTGGRTVFEYEPHLYSRVISDYSSGIDALGTNKVAGGLRIKSITDYPGGSKQEKRTFSYNDVSGGLSSGILSGSPRTRTSGHVVIRNSQLDYNVDYTLYSENPIFPLSETDGNHVTYSYVRESHPDGGYTVFHYSNHETSGCLDELPYMLGYEQESTPYSRLQSHGLQRGLLLERKDYRSDGVVVRTETNTYQSSTQVYFKSVAEESYCNDAFSLLSYVKKYCYYPCLTQKTVVESVDTGTAITETFNYQYNSDRRPTSQTHTVKGVTDGTVTFYPADRNGSVYAGMRQAGMSGIPVGQVQTRRGKVIAGQELTFRAVPVETASGAGTTYLPDKLYSTNLTAPVSLSAYSANPAAYLSSAPEVEYRTYDSHGNLTGSVTADGIGTAYRWSADGLQPTLVAKGVRIPASILGDQAVQANHAISFNNDGLNATYHFTTVGASRTVSASIYGSSNYDWLFEVQVDGQSGRIVSSQIPGAPPQSWIQYLSSYSSSIQFVVPAGEHTLTLREINYRTGNGASGPPYGSISLSYFNAGNSSSGAADTVVVLDFEDGTGTVPGFRDGYACSGSYTVNYQVPSDRPYVLDYMLWNNGSWQYRRENYSGGSVTLGGSGKRLDNIRIFPSDCDIVTASYDDAALMISRTDARGVTESYEYDALQRLTGLRDNTGNDGNLVERYSYHYANASSIHNSVTTTTYTQADNATFRTSVAYLDSLGRPVQNVLVDGAASGWDLITYQDYDACGREFRKWLPAPVQVGSQHAAGAYASLAQLKTGGNQVYASGDAYRYEQPVYEASPRNRVKELYGPGAAWRSGAGHKTKVTMASNTTTTSSVMYYRGYSVTWTGNTSLTLSRAAAASAASLQIMQTEDEDERKTLEFKDSFGQTVLVRQVYSSNVFYDTYYVYDDLGRLAAVLPPKLSERLSSGSSWSYGDISDLAYLYRYDARGNCIARSLPGAGWTYTVYDRGNRPVLTQDAAQRAQSANSWAFAIPDHLGRPALRGTATLSVDVFSDPYRESIVQASLPASPSYSNSYRGYTLSGITLSSPSLLEVDYYDNYSFAGASPFPAGSNADFAYDSSVGTSFSARYAPSAQGLQTGSLLRVLDSSAGNQYLWSVRYYDDWGRVVQCRASTHLGGVEKDWFLYDFAGNATKHQVQHKPSSGSALTETVTQTYSLWGLPLMTTHKLGSATTVTISDRTYDKAGRLSSDKRNGSAALKSTFSYNIRSWMTGLSGTLFSETLKYQDGPSPRWGGDISQESWKDKRSSQLKTYTFSYNTLGWLTGASFSDAASSASNFSENITGYDRNGNITGLQRRGRTGASSYGLIDNLAYTYTGNKLMSIKDTGAAAYSSDFRYSNGTNNTYTYAYDAAGRMTKDASKGITSIAWNVLHLPQTVTFSDGATISYTYAADGTKLRETRTISGSTTTTDYTGDLVLENGTRSRLFIDGGYVSLSGNAYHWFLTDHLGSVRVVASSSGAAEEYDHYYPLGGPIAQYSSASSLQPLKFQGKEWSTAKSMNLYDFGARRYDPASGRWLSQDPLAEKYYAHSPYLFCAANPMTIVDPTGVDILPSQLAYYLGVIPEYQYSQLLDEDYGPYSVLAYYDSNGNVVGYGASRMVKNGQNRETRFDYVMTDASDLSFFADNVNVLSVAADIFNLNGGPTEGQLSIITGNIMQGLKMEWSAAIHNPVYWMYAIGCAGYSSLALRSSRTVEQLINESGPYVRTKHGRLGANSGTILDDLYELSNTYEASIQNTNGKRFFKVPGLYVGTHTSTTTNYPTLDINSKTSGMYKIRYKK